MRQKKRVSTPFSDQHPKQQLSPVIPKASTGTGHKTNIHYLNCLTIIIQLLHFFSLQRFYDCKW